MGKHKSLESTMQSQIDNTRDAKNSAHGFKNAMSSGTHGAGDAYGHKK